jgi:hypothetical protein
MWNRSETTCPRTPLLRHTEAGRKVHFPDVVYLVENDTVVLCQIPEAREGFSFALATKNGVRANLGFPDRGFRTNSPASRNSIAGHISYRALFSWWLSPALDRRSQKSFADEIKQAAPFLLAQYEGKVVSDPRSEAHDRGVRGVCITSGNLFLRFSQWRTESYDVRVSPTLCTE